MSSDAWDGFPADDAYADLGPELLVRRDGGVRVVILNRPAELNAADARLHNALSRVWPRLGLDRAVRAVILTGAGKAFSAGGDFELMRQQAEDIDLCERMFAEARAIITGMAELPQVLVAAVNGAAVGLGASLAAFSDVVVMSERSFLSDPHLGVGLVAGDGAAMVWPLLLGLQRAKELVFTGDRVPAARALELGLANRVVAPQDVATEALGLARRFAALPSRALQDTKRMMNVHLQRALAGMLDVGITTEMRSATSAEHRAFIADLMTRRSTTAPKEQPQ